MATIIRDRDLLAILKGANALAAQIVAAHPELFGEQATRPTTEEAANDSSSPVRPTDRVERPATVVR